MIIYAPAPSRLSLGGLLLAGTALASVASVNTPASAPAAGGAKLYAGSSNYRECHERFYGLWSKSQYGFTMQPLTTELARTNLAPQPGPLVIGAYRYQSDPALGNVMENGSEEQRPTLPLAFPKLCMKRNR